MLTQERIIQVHPLPALPGFLAYPAPPAASSSMSKGSLLLYFTYLYHEFTALIGFLALAEDLFLSEIPQRVRSDKTISICGSFIERAKIERSCRKERSDSQIEMRSITQEGPLQWIQKREVLVLTNPRYEISYITSHAPKSLQTKVSMLNYAAKQLSSNLDFISQVHSRSKSPDLLRSNLTDTTQIGGIWKIHLIIDFLQNSKSSTFEALPGS